MNKTNIYANNAHVVSKEIKWLYYKMTEARPINSTRRGSPEGVWPVIGKGCGLRREVYGSKGTPNYRYTIHN